MLRPVLRWHLLLPLLRLLLRWLLLLPLLRRRILRQRVLLLHLLRRGSPHRSRSPAVGV